MHLHMQEYGQIVEAVQITAESISPAFETALIFLEEFEQSVLHLSLLLK